MSRTFLLACLIALAVAAPARAETFTVVSFDGTPINTNFFAAEGLKAGERAPTVFFGPGYSSGGDTNPNAETSEPFGYVGVGTLRRAGYNVVTWDPRGFGKSGGTVQVDSPEHEARDVQAIIDVVAKRPEVLLDAPGDPRMGMSGGSYGGGIQFNTAQREPRVDVIVPSIAWHSLITSLFKEGNLKGGWGSILCGAGEGRGLAEGILAPGGPHTGSHDPVVTRTCVNGTATGSVPSAEDQAWFAARGPGQLIERIRIPTFIIQGTVDTLFTLREAMDNHAILQRNGVPLKMLWFCGGHGACRTGSGEAKHFEKRVLAWLDRHLRGRDVDTGPAFEWIADDAKWRSAAGFPVPERARVAGTGTGTLALEPAGQSGTLVAATPAPPGTAFEVALDPLASESDVLGEPRLKLTYSGTGSAGRTWVYAQIVDLERGNVAGNQVTPIPLELDGAEHTVERPLEPIALRGAAGKRYRLQLVASSSVYYPSKVVGSVAIKQADVSLPVVDPAAAQPSRAEERGRVRAGTCTGGPAGFKRVKVRGGRRLTFRILRHRARAFRVELRRDGRRVRTIPRRPGTFRYSRAVPAGRYTIRLVMPLPRKAKDVREVTAVRRNGRWRVGPVRRLGTC